MGDKLFKVIHNRCNEVAYLSDTLPYKGQLDVVLYKLDGTKLQKGDII